MNYSYEEKVKRGYVKRTDMNKVKKRYQSLPNDAKPIPDYPTYYATPNGEIWRDSPGKGIRKSRIIKLKDRYNPKNGYYQIQPYVNEKKTMTYTHRLVLAAFKGWPPKGYECNHIDANTSNNCLSNLEWITKEENLEFRIIKNRTYDEGRKKHKPYNSKWKDIKPQILQLRKEGKTAKEISSKLKVPVKFVYSVK